MDKDKKLKAIKSFKTSKLKNLKIKHEIVETCLDIWESGLREFFILFYFFYIYIFCVLLFN